MIDRLVYRTLVINGSGTSTFHLDAYSTVYDSADSAEIIDETRFADINGDGLADSVAYYQVPGENAGWYFRLSNGTSFESKVSVSGISGNGSTRSSVQLVDVNNDGHPDFVWHDKTAQQMKARLWRRARLCRLRKRFTALVG
ncbi:hypothetical protein LCGC14_3041260, partial [marine sediment metagenome]